jgi:hypothetical protein
MHAVIQELERYERDAVAKLFSLTRSLGEFTNPTR